MTRFILLGAVAAVSALGYATFTLGSSRRRTAAKNAEQPMTVNLAGLATIQLAPSFHAIGPGTTGPGAKDGFDPASVEFHNNERQITFQFEQNQKRNMGGYTEDPVLLNVSLVNPALPTADALRIGGTTVGRFYPPVDDEPRKAAHFAAQEWLADVTKGDVLTRSAATNQGRGDNLVSDPPARWLVIHVDAARHVRVDMYVWQKMYSLEEARTLTRRVAESVQPAPRLPEFFAAVKTVEQRLADKHSRTVNNAIARLRPCGIEALKAGEIALKDTCAAWLSDDRRYLHVVRALAKLPLASATQKSGQVPQFNVVVLPKGKPAELIGPPDFQPAMFFWDSLKNSWTIDGFGEQMYSDEARESPLLGAISATLQDKSSVHVISMARYDLQFWAERVAIEAFLSESSRMEQALRGGAMISGVRAAPYLFVK